MSSLRLPPYVDLPGDPVYPGPFMQDQTEMRGFVVPLDSDRIQRFCERAFTETSGGAVRVRPTSDVAVLSFARIGRIVSMVEGWRSRGYTQETDIIFWVPVEVTIGSERFAAWVMPFIFVDRAHAVATGREHYGFPKLQARPEIPESMSAPGASYRVWADAITHHSPSSEAREELILELRPGSGVAPSRIQAVRSLGKLLQGGDGVLSSLLSAGSLRNLLSREIPVLFLRQLRDIHEPTRAIFQEIVIASARHERVHGGGFIDGSWRLHVPNRDSPPVARTLGIPAEGVEAQAAFWTRFDFAMELGQTLWRAGGEPAKRQPRKVVKQQPVRKKRIAVLGGGISALSAVFELTARSGWQDEYEVTVYQMGHRLGGKGASGRNQEIADRIEEHGLHIWFGFYENAFRLMRRCYAEAARPHGSPLATWQDAFKPHSNVVLTEEIGGQWESWGMPFPTNEMLPGDEHPEQSLAEQVRMLAAYTADLIEQSISELAPQGDSPSELAVQAAFVGVAAVLRVLHRLALEVAEDPGLGDSRLYNVVQSSRRRLWAQMEQRVEQDAKARRIWITLDFALTTLYGVYRDRVVERGIECIDHLDFREWLAGHGASDMTLRSALLRAGYDLAFAFEDGDPERPNFAAGAGLYGYMRMLFTYKGAVMWRMQTGMGDAVFAPLYEVLKSRGVRFEFFHHVEHLGLSADRSRIDTIQVTRQAALRSGVREYEPLVSVQGSPCWPARPRWEQLVGGAEMAAAGVDLESMHGGGKPVERITLQHGQHFDSIILGIPVGALKAIAGELIEQDPKWRRMVERCKTVCTHAVQLWTRPDRHALGWRNPTSSAEDPILGAFVEPTDTWADMTHLLPVESWPAAHRPGHIAYFCGPLKDPLDTPTAPSAGFLAREKTRVMGLADLFLDRHLGLLWPQATDAQGRFRRELLIDLHDRATQDRLATQWIKANVEPTDRYTLSLKGTLADRLPAGGSGFANLFLAGDWVDNGFNAGCIEACVMSGMQCTRALTGWDLPIYGENPRLRKAAAAALANRTV